MSHELIDVGTGSDRENRRLRQCFGQRVTDRGENERRRTGGDVTDLEDAAHRDRCRHAHRVCHERGSTEAVPVALDDGKEIACTGSNPCNVLVPCGTSYDETQRHEFLARFTRWTAQRTSSMSAVTEIAVVNAMRNASVWLSSSDLPPMKPSSAA